MNWATNMYKGKKAEKKVEAWKDGPNSPAYKEHDWNDVYSKYGIKFTGNLARN